MFLHPQLVNGLHVPYHISPLGCCVLAFWAPDRFDVPFHMLPTTD